MRSQSGSVARTTSQPLRSASATAFDKASAFSGFGDLTVGKPRIERHLLAHLVDVAARVDEERRRSGRRPCRGCS